MLYPPNDKSIRKCKSMLGNPVRGGVTGTRSLFVKETDILEANGFEYPIHKAKVSFEQYEHGLLMRFNATNQLALCPLPFEDINKVIISGGDEQVDLYFLSPLWCLLKLGVNLRYARYLSLRGEYDISALSLIISAKQGRFLLSSSGYDHRGIASFFKRLPLAQLEFRK